jgi:hypothetical protein
MRVGEANTGKIYATLLVLGEHTHTHTYTHIHTAATRTHAHARTHNDAHMYVAAYAWTDAGTQVRALTRSRAVKGRTLFAPTTCHAQACLSVYVCI